MRRVAICVLLMSTLLMCDDKPVGRAVFLEKSDGTLQPIYPVRLRVTLESGKIRQRAGSLSCEVRARTQDSGKGWAVIQTILRCDDGGTYVINGVLYQDDHR